MTADRNRGAGGQVEGEGSRAITREELHELVWSAPLRTLARRFGVSDFALSKICRRLAVPRPGPGYWARVQRGQKPPRASLPAPGADTPAAAVVAPSAFRAKASSQGAANRKELPASSLSDSLARSHQAVRLLRQALADRSPVDGMLVLPGDGGSVLRVSPAARDRALAILDAFAKALVARGHEVVAVAPDRVAGPYTFEVIVAGRGIALSLHERVRRGGEHRQPSPSGCLVLRVGRTSGDRHRSWADGRRTRLEDKLGQAVPGTEEVAADQIAEDHRWDERMARYREAVRQQAAVRLRAEYGQALVRDLAEMAAAWRESRQLHLFLEAVDLSMPEDLRGPGFTAWMTWARGYAVQRDPLNWPDQIAKRLDPVLPDGAGPAGRG